MAQVKFFFWAYLLLVFMVVAVCSMTNQAEVGQPAARDRSCEQLRQRLLPVLQQIYSRSVQPFPLRLLMSNWAENFISAICRSQIKSTPTINQTQLNEIEKLFRPTPVVEATLASPEPKNESNSKQSNYGVKLNVQENIGPSSSNKVHYETDISWNNEITHSLNLQDEAKGHIVQSRVKRFLSEGQPGSAPDLWTRLLQGQTQTRVKQMGTNLLIMNYIRQLTNIQRNKLIQEYLATRMRQGTGFSNGLFSLSKNVYNNAYRRKKKREAVGVAPLMQSKANLRKKRFLFGDIPEVQPMPSLFNMMMGTAVDPNTGQRMEFGGDVMRNYMMDTFISFLPPSAQPPPGKEPGDLTKIMAPMWFFGNMQQAMNPATRYNARSQPQRKNAQGYYGDTLYGKRRKRSASSGSDRRSN